MRRVLPWLITVAGCFLVTGALATVKYQQITAAIAFGASFPEPYEVVSAQKVSTVSIRLFDVWVALSVVQSMWRLALK